MPTTKSTANLLTEISQIPEDGISEFGLVYVNSDSFPILRKKYGRGFTYHLNGKTLKDKEELRRIKSLVIPPNWSGVKITEKKAGHLQAVGRDAKKRKQYRYHPKWTKIRNNTKFYKMHAFGIQLPKIRKQVDYDLEHEGWPKEKVIALVIRLMEETHIRIGNQQYANRNGTYGLTTLRKRHLNIDKDKLQIEFIGKRGKEHKISLRNRKLIRLVSRCEELPGWELFKYYDKAGDKQVLDSSDVNEYLHRIAGEFFTAKDFRTWAASVTFFNTLSTLKPTNDTAEKSKNLLTAFDSAAKALGNTRNVCRKYYVHPKLVEAYENNTLHTYFENVRVSFTNEEYLTVAEKELLKLLKEYTPELAVV